MPDPTPEPYIDPPPRLREPCSDDCDQCRLAMSKCPGMDLDAAEVARERGHQLSTHVRLSHGGDVTYEPVARERATGPSITGGTVTNVTLYPYHYHHGLKLRHAHKPMGNHEGVMWERWTS